MRLIDADITQTIADTELNIEEAGKVQYILLHTPTINPEDLRPKSSWEFGVKRGASGYWCSNCESGFTGENAEWIAKEHDYCPKCGAKMEE